MIIVCCKFCFLEAAYICQLTYLPTNRCRFVVCCSTSSLSLSLYLSPSLSHSRAPFILIEIDANTTIQHTFLLLLLSLSHIQAPVLWFGEFLSRFRFILRSMHFTLSHSLAIRSLSCFILYDSFLIFSFT